VKQVGDESWFVGEKESVKENQSTCWIYFTIVLYKPSNWCRNVSRHSKLRMESRTRSFSLIVHWEMRWLFYHGLLNDTKSKWRDPYQTIIIEKILKSNERMLYWLNSSPCKVAHEINQSLVVFYAIFSSHGM
jgi:hypothetical protein